MSKRKRATFGKTSTGADQTASEAPDSNDDASVTADMAHVSPDVLAGSPDIFASQPKEADHVAAEMVSEPVTDEPIAEPMATSSAESTPASSFETAPEPVFAPSTMSAPPAPYVTAVPHPPRSRSGSSAALGIVLVVLGLFALGVVLFGIDLTQYGWPLFVIIPGLTLLVVGFLGGGASASVPGGIVTMLGLVLAYQSSSRDWASWTFAWALVAPGGVGLGLYLQALRDRDPVMLRRGRVLLFIGAMIALIGFVLFESILGISGQDYGVFGKAAIPALLIIIGIVLLVRSMQRNRRAQR